MYISNVYVYIHTCSRSSHQRTCSGCSHLKEHGLSLRFPEKRGGPPPSECLASSAAADTLAIVESIQLIDSVEFDRVNIKMINICIWYLYIHWSLSPPKAGHKNMRKTPIWMDVYCLENVTFIKKMGTCKCNLVFLVRCVLWVIILSVCVRFCVSFVYMNMLLHLFENIVYMKVNTYII